MPHAPRTLWPALGLTLLAGCPPAVTVDEPDDPEALGRDESRTIELRFLRLDAKGFSQTLTRADIKARFPERILRETWLLDMPIEPLIMNALDILVSTPEDVAYTLDPSALNMWKLLNMTPANTVLTGSSLEPLLGIGEAVGLPPSLVLSNLIGIPANEGIISVAQTTPIIIDQVVSTHPNAQWRRAPPGSTCPDGQPETSGLCRVTPGSMPVSLWDVVTDFQDLPKTFGPATDPFNPKISHPGFVASASPIIAAKPNFEMTVKVDLNALPYKGVDLATASVASVNSTESQVADAFDFSTDDWMTIKGLADDLVIDKMVMAIHENPAHIASGTSPDPAPRGDSPVWGLPLYQFERIIAEVAYQRSEQLTAHCNAYVLEGDVDMPYEAIDVCIGQGAFLNEKGVPCGQDSDDETCQFDPSAPAPQHWVSLAVDDIVKLEDPLPPQSYFWDILLEVAQLRLHDGGLAEGEADIAFELERIAAGISTVELEAKIRENIQKNPAALAAIAELLNENTVGDADFYYYHAGAEAAADLRGDWLYFIAPGDIKGDTQGDPVRPYENYAAPGFFADEDTTEKVSKTEDVAGDTVHEKVRIAPGDVLYAQDDAANVFKIEVGEKPDRHVVSLTITRVR